VLLRNIQREPGGLKVIFKAKVDGVALQVNAHVVLTLVPLDEYFTRTCSFAAAFHVNCEELLRIYIVGLRVLHEVHIHFFVAIFISVSLRNHPLITLHAQDEMNPFRVAVSSLKAPKLFLGVGVF